MFKISDECEKIEEEEFLKKPKIKNLKLHMKKQRRMAGEISTKMIGNGLKKGN
jgi:hypothetical protein